MKSICRQVTRLLEMALRIVTSTRFASPLEKATNPYVLLLDTFSSLEKYPQSDEAHKSYCVLMHKLAVHTEYGTFDALSDCIRQNMSNGEGVEADRTIQVVSNAVVATLRLPYLHATQQQQIARQFAVKVLLTPSSVSSSVGVRCCMTCVYAPNVVSRTDVFVHLYGVCIAVCVVQSYFKSRVNCAQR